MRQGIPEGDRVSPDKAPTHYSSPSGTPSRSHNWHTPDVTWTLRRIAALTLCATLQAPASAVALTETQPSQHALPSYTMQTKTYSRAAAAWALVALVLIQQVYTSPVLGGQVDSTSTHLENGGLLKRVARMTPLWRIMGSKPFGAYCKNNYECSTGICRGGHCSFSQPIRS
ncbi:hypothetical protein JZ751_018718 [Albula glossodonta]|uniref:Liver-expressed antimicrobial peptide 2 n=1 Tax=Albula glossodonta TaxID=121402 RepID=A0A8T2NMR5_9TELE|nr:hypothetical protein JZ751_018718 [Albula glossodonta]